MQLVELTKFKLIGLSALHPLRQDELAMLVYKANVGTSDESGAATEGPITASRDPCNDDGGLGLFAKIEGFAAYRDGTSNTLMIVEENFPEKPYWEWCRQHVSTYW
jgi:hypothetical protein